MRDRMVTMEETGRRVLQPGIVREWCERCRCRQATVERQMFTDAVKWWVICDTCQINEHLLCEDERFLHPDDKRLAREYLEDAASRPGGM